MLKIFNKHNVRQHSPANTNSYKLKATFTSGAWRLSKRRSKHRSVNPALRSSLNKVHVQWPQTRLLYLFLFLFDILRELRLGIVSIDAWIFRLAVARLGLGQRCINASLPVACRHCSLPPVCERLATLLQSHPGHGSEDSCFVEFFYATPLLLVRNVETLWNNVAICSSKRQIK